MESPKQQAADRVKQASSVLVTVSSNPSVDQLAACIGLTLAINKLGKHATAVFSGAVPSMIEFLQPEKTLEKNTDSLRDFIIALDKSKADKLRYKVEDKVVKIFITPYRTSISEKDLEFSQGDFNVDAVIALGVHSQADLDQVITAHGRILHDATVITVNTKPGGELGGINWVDPAASSLSELATELVLLLLDKKSIDRQIATSLLTGIVAETDRFSNVRTSPQTMSVSADLMAAGADQQLVATKLEEPAPPPPPAPVTPASGSEKVPVSQVPKQDNDGTLEIEHDDKPIDELPQPLASAPPPPYVSEDENHGSAVPQIHIDEHGSLSPVAEGTLPPKAPDSPPSIGHHDEPPKIMLEPPTMGGQLGTAAPAEFGGSGEAASGMPPTPSAGQESFAPAMGQGAVPNADSDEEEPSAGSPSSDSFLVGSEQPAIPAPATTTPSPGFPSPEETLSDIEADVHSSHLGSDNSAQPEIPVSPQTPSMDAPVSSETINVQPYQQPEVSTADGGNSASQNSDVTKARDAVEKAINNSPSLEPLQSLNAQTVDLPLNAANGVGPVTDPMASYGQPTQQNQGYDPTGNPPPGPPPMMPPPTT